MATILLILAIFLFILWAGFYIGVIFYNKSAKATTDKFIAHAAKLNPVVFQDVEIRYHTVNGLKAGAYPNNRCDLYLFGNCLAIVRRQDFVFKVFFSPILITPDVAATRYMFNYLVVYKPDSITFKQIMKGEVDIKLTDLMYAHYKMEMTLKGLTGEQIAQLGRIKGWC